MIKFENVSVTYPGGVEALKNLDLEINEGDFLIIVGLSGAGKSTLINMLCRFQDPTSGTILIDGVDLRNLKLRELN